MIPTATSKDLSWLKSTRSIRSASTVQTQTSFISLPPLGQRGGCDTTYTFASGQGLSPAIAWTRLAGTRTLLSYLSLKVNRLRGRVSIRCYSGSPTLNCSEVLR